MKISLDQMSQILYSLQLSYVRVEVYQYLFKLKFWSFTFNLYKASLEKKKKEVGASLPGLFSP